MFKSLIFILFTGTVSIGFTQNSVEKPYNEVGRKPGLMRHYTMVQPSETSPERFDRFNTDFFFNNWLGDRNGVATRFYAIGHGINLMFDLPFSKQSRFGVGIGLGYTHYNIRHDGDFSFQTMAVPQMGLPQYSVLSPYNGANRWINRTVFNQVDIPIEFRIRSRKERRKFKFYPGFKIGYVFDTFEKWRVENLEFKTFNFPDVNKLQYGPTVRIGFNNVFLFGSYNLTYLFEHENSSKLNLFSAGISIGWF
ncbi:MAG: hypothetical protein AB8B72_03060 [Crocinitomicaceae bacterium]